jgi:hypothetical protein
MTIALNVGWAPGRFRALLTPPEQEPAYECSDQSQPKRAREDHEATI